jgi:FAD/FMN-containing dehydrogenase
VTAALLIWRPEAGAEVLPVYRDFMNGASDDLGGGAIYLTGPELDFVPEKLRGRLALAVLVVYAGGEAKARKLAAPFLGLAPDGVMIAEMPYADFQCMLDDPPGFRNYWSAEYIDQLPDAAIERFCARAPDMIVPSPSQHALFPGGGAVARESANWPIPWRNAPWCVHPFGLWPDAADDKRGRQWAHDVKDDMKPWSIGAVYLNFIGDEGEDRVLAGFGADNYARLSRIKAQYDPDNLFHLNHNISPA